MRDWLKNLPSIIITRAPRPDQARPVELSEDDVKPTEGARDVEPPSPAKRVSSSDQVDELARDAFTRRFPGVTFTGVPDMGLIEESVAIEPGATVRFPE